MHVGTRVCSEHSDRPRPTATDCDRPRTTATDRDRLRPTATDRDRPRPTERSGLESLQLRFLSSPLPLRPLLVPTGTTGGKGALHSYRNESDCETNHSSPFCAELHGAVTSVHHCLYFVLLRKVQAVLSRRS